jgi:hypothetical protein
VWAGAAEPSCQASHRAPATAATKNSHMISLQHFYFIPATHFQAQLFSGVPQYVMTPNEQMEGARDVTSECFPPPSSPADAVVLYWVKLDLVKRRPRGCSRHVFLSGVREEGGAPVASTREAAAHSGGRGCNRYNDRSGNEADAAYDTADGEGTVFLAAARGRVCRGFGEGGDVLQGGHGGADGKRTL